MSAILTTCPIGLKIGILLATGLCAGFVGYRLGRGFDTFMVADRSPALQALRLVDRIAADRGLSQGDLLRAMLEQHEQAERARPQKAGHQKER